MKWRLRMSKNYFKYLFKSNKVLIAFIAVIQALICIVESLTYNNNSASLNYSGNTIFAYALVFVLPILFLNHAQNKKSVDSYFALPVKRKAIILTSIFFMWLLIIIPLILVLIAYSLIDSGQLTYYLYALFISTISFLVLLIFNSGIYLIGNNNVDGIIMMIAYSILPFILIGLLSSYFNKICYGFSLNTYYYCRYISLLYSSYVNLNAHVEITSQFIPWLITIAIYFVSGYVAIKKHYINRKAERAQTISDNLFAYPFVIHTMIIMLIFMISISYQGYAGGLGDMILLYLLTAILFEILSFVYRRMIKVKIKDIVVIALTILLSIGFVKISFYYEGFGLSYLYDHSPKNVAYRYNMWNVQDNDVHNLLLEKYDEVRYYCVYFDLSIVEKDMDKNKDLNEWFNSLRDKSIKEYFSSDFTGYDSSLRVVNNAKEVNGEVSLDYYPHKLNYFYDGIHLSLNELKYINDNYTTVYIEADIVTNIDNTLINDKGNSADKVLTQSEAVSDYLVFTLDDILEK